MDTRPVPEPLNVLRLVVDERTRLAAVWEQVSSVHALSNRDEARRHVDRGGSLEDLLLRDGFTIRWLTPARSPLPASHALHDQVSELLEAAQMRPLRATISQAFARSETSLVHLLRVECPELAPLDAEPAPPAAAPPRARAVAPLGAA